MSESTTPTADEAPPRATNAAPSASPHRSSIPLSTGRFPFAPVGAAVGALAAFVVRDLDLPALVSYQHAREPLVLAAALVGALVSASTRLRRLLFAGTAALVLLWCVVAFSPASAWLSRGLTRTEAPEPADAVFVSFSSLRPGAQGAGEVRNRLFHGIALVGRGKAPRLVVCNSAETPGEAIARELLEATGAKAELVVLSKAQNTRDEALAVAELARDRGFRLVLLVTSPIHSRRASGTLEKEGVTVVSSPSVETRFDLETLDTWNDRLAAFGSVMHERLGLWVYARRGWISSAAE